MHCMHDTEFSADFIKHSIPVFEKGMQAVYVIPNLLEGSVPSRLFGVIQFNPKESWQWPPDARLLGGEMGGGIVRLKWMVFGPARGLRFVYLLITGCKYCFAYCLSTANVFVTVYGAGVFLYVIWNVNLLYNLSLFPTALCMCIYFSLL